MKDPRSHQVRRLVLGEQTMGVLTGRYKRVSDNVAIAEISLSPDAYVISPDFDGSKPMLPGAVTLAFRRLYNTMAEKTNDEWPYRFHDLRHYTATELFRARSQCSYGCGPPGPRRPLSVSAGLHPRHGGPAPACGGVDRGRNPH